GALLHGGRLVVVPQPTARSPQEFYRLLCEQGVTVLNQTPSAFRALVAAQVDESGADESGTHGLRWVVFGGEALEPAMLAPWYRDARNRATRLVNMYGITETTVHVTFREMEAADAERAGASPIGRPLGDLRLYLLDGSGEPVPVGVAGEIHVGGAGVARGYLNRPGLTSERFVASPFVEGDRLYRSGDLARWRADGSLEFLGRNDFQVKVRGFRIELGEIEARLSGCPGVREAVVVAREDRLAAYYTTAAGAQPGAEVLRAHLGSALPDYMVPAAYVRLDALPLTANGKLDRKALPAPDDDAYGTRSRVAPRTPIEEEVARIWAELLGVDEVGVTDDFFQLGGHSLLATRVVSRIQDSLGADLPLRVLFDRPTVEGIVEHIFAEFESS
ncbi:non-ribosomal peptide synthetase, partial [Arenibaculum sp.]|uniref:non-ribosomal peptide synthetase n=1 Tax=Arenibaculum sp. TaxID=2865862 RepID=UPI002E138467|nr:non-ribosomal peptide synthetase [Arenibaculum sp.]